MYSADENRHEKESINTIPVPSVVDPVPMIYIDLAFLNPDPEKQNGAKKEEHNHKNRFFFF